MTDSRYAITVYISAADREIAGRMRGMGYSELHVTMALMNASPETADKTYEQAQQYGQEISAQAITPGLQYSRGYGLR